MPRPSPMKLDLAKLLTQAGRIIAEDDPAALEQLLALAFAALQQAESALYAVGEDAACVFVAGNKTARLDEAVRAQMDNAPLPDNARAILLAAGGQTVGVWTVLAPSALDDAAWKTFSEALAPFLALGVRRQRWRAEFQAAQVRSEAAQTQVEQRIREVATVYEIGQAMDKVPIDRLLDMVTERAAAAMDASACSLMLMLPDPRSLFIAASYGLADDIVENTRIFVGEGIAGSVAASGKPLRLAALADDPRFSKMAGVPGVDSSLCMPMKDGDGDVLGVLCIRRAIAPAFTEEDERLFSIFASQAALAINNAQLYAKLSAKIQAMSTVAALTGAIISTLDLDQVLNQVADSIVDVVHFDRCRIYLSDVDTGRFSPRIVRGFRRAPGLPGEPSVAMGEGVVGMAARQQTPILADDLSQAPPAWRKYAQALDMESFNAQPIVTRGRCIGVIVVSNTGPHRPMDASSIELLRTLVDQAGIAIENARLHESRERRYAELATLYDVSKTLAATSGVQKAAETVNDLAARITDSDASLLVLLDTAQDAMTALTWRGVSETLDRRLKSFVVPVPVTAWTRDLREPRLLVADDVETLFGPDWQPVCEAFLARHRACALIPLVVDETAVGFLLLGKRGSDYGEEELKLIAVASSQAAAVLASASSYERRNTLRGLEVSAVYELMQKVRSATALDDALSSILDIVARLVWSDSSALMTLEDDGETLTVRAARGETAAAWTVGQTARLTDDGIAARALRERTALVDTEMATRRSHLALPLVVGSELVGVLLMESKTPDVYTEESVTMLSLVASQAATIYREISSFRTLTRSTEDILRSIAVGVITINKTGHVATWNARAEEIIGLKADRIVGRPYAEFIQRLQADESARAETVAMLDLTAHIGKVLRSQLTIQSPQGEEIFVNLSAFQLKSASDDYLGVVVVVEDITNEVQMAQEVERATKLAETGQLAANIAHELRNPLASIKGAAQLLRNALPSEFQDEHGEFLDIIIEETNGLNRMMSEFLEFSRVTPPEMRLVSLNALVSRLLNFMTPYLDDEDVSVHLTLDERLPDVFVDKAQIEQVLKNIVINAAQAMPHGGTLTIATCYYAIQDIVELSLTDTGVGIPANKMEKIWTPFYTSKTKGTGLGLAISRKIVETHNGRLSVRSTPGDGSTFTLHLPITPSYVQPIPPSRQEIADQRSDRPGTLYERGEEYHAPPF